MRGRRMPHQKDLCRQVRFLEKEITHIIITLLNRKCNNDFPKNLPFADKYTREMLNI